MEKRNNLRSLEIAAGKTGFTDDVISIVAGQVCYNNNKHYMLEPQKAKAYFFWRGERYVIENTEGFSTVEDWYCNELLPKIQMLTLLLCE